MTPLIPHNLGKPENPGPAGRLIWDLATESILVRLRWFGILMGYALVAFRPGLRDPWALSAFLALGAGYAALDTAWHAMGDVFLRRWPLFVSAMESIFIALLCYHDTGLESPFRWYYLLSLICCAIRYPPHIAWFTCSMHAASLLILERVLDPSTILPGSWLSTVVILAWATWATSALAGVLKATGARLEAANAELERQSLVLEQRVAARTEELRASQARLIHQEKMAAFGLLAAGIAHEVGNPLTALSSLVQILKRRKPEPYTAEKLDLVERQIQRISRTIRDLVDFSRPAAHSRGPIPLPEVVEDVLAIARYYQRTGERELTCELPRDLPHVSAVRDHLTQVLLNLVLNAIDATHRGGMVRILGQFQEDPPRVLLEVQDNGRGVPPDDQPRLFQPYFTTKPQGTGLGLYVSRQILQEIGGTLEHQPRPGGGSIFRISLPAALEPQLAAASLTSRAAGSVS